MALRYASVRVTSSPNHKRERQARRLWTAAIVLLLLFAAAAAWKWTPLADLIDVNRLSGWAASLRQSPARYLYLLGFYVIGSILLVPITALILVSAIIFGPIMGSLYSIAGSLAGAAVTYAIGRLLGQDFVRKIAGRKWRRLEQKIGQTGIVAVAALRLLPIAPFTVINVISGAFKVPLRDYALGSLLGLVPGILITNLFAHQLTSAIRDPGVGAVLILVALVAVTVVGIVWLKRRLGS
jgi:phospholipase D1/2